MQIIVKLRDEAISVGGVFVMHPSEEDEPPTVENHGASRARRGWLTALLQLAPEPTLELELPEVPELDARLRELLHLKGVGQGGRAGG